MVTFEDVVVPEEVGNLPLQYYQPPTADIVISVLHRMSSDLLAKVSKLL